MKFKTFIILFLLIFAFCIVTGVAYTDQGNAQPNFSGEYCYEFNNISAVFTFVLKKMHGGNYLLTGKIEEEVIVPHAVFRTFPVLGNMVIVDGVKLIHFTFSRIIRDFDDNGKPINNENADNVVNSGSIYLYPEMDFGKIQGVSSFGNEVLGTGGSSAFSDTMNRIPCPE